MRFIIDIPDAFLAHWNEDRFKDSLMRLNADAHLLAGNYEQETAEMLIKAFPSRIRRHAVFFNADLCDLTGSFRRFRIRRIR